jgi:hypothetical protein
MVTCLPTRTSVLGVTNPRGAFNPTAAHTGSATNISSPLLSRFDVVLVLSDVHEPTWDAIVSGHVLSNHQQVGGLQLRGGRGGRRHIAGPGCAAKRMGCGVELGVYSGSGMPAWGAGAPLTRGLAFFGNRAAPRVAKRRQCLAGLWTFCAPTLHGRARRAAGSRCVCPRDTARRGSLPSWALPHVYTAKFCQQGKAPPSC